jgi:hypothetical protein
MLSGIHLDLFRLEPRRLPAGMATKKENAQKRILHQLRPGKYRVLF